MRGQCPTCSSGWARKPASWSGGSTREWRTFRASWLADHPLCIDADLNPEICLGLATVVCHKPGTNYARDRCNPDAIDGQRCQPCDAHSTSRQGRAAQG